MREGYGCSLIADTALVYHSEGPGFDPQHGQFKNKGRGVGGGADL